MKAIVFDTETTGLVINRTLKLDNQPSIIEFYGCLADLDTGEIETEIDCLINPPKPLSDTPDKKGGKTITQITGITNEMLEGMPGFLEVAPEIFKLLEEAPLIIAHNLSFDKDVVEIEAERLSRKIKWPRGVCTVEATIGMKGHRLSLSALHFELFKESFEGAHRAKQDVAALLRCVLELKKRDMI